MVLTRVRHLNHHYSEHREVA